MTNVLGDKIEALKRESKERERESKEREREAKKREKEAKKKEVELREMISGLQNDVDRINRLFLEREVCFNTTEAYSRLAQGILVFYLFALQF